MLLSFYPCELQLKCTDPVSSVPPRTKNRIFGSSNDLIFFVLVLIVCVGMFEGTCVTPTSRPEIVDQTDFGFLQAGRTARLDGLWANSSPAREHSKQQVDPLSLWQPM